MAPKTYLGCKVSGQYVFKCRRVDVGRYLDAKADHYVIQSKSDFFEPDRGGRRFGGLSGPCFLGEAWMDLQSRSTGTKDDVLAWALNGWIHTMFE